MNSLQSLSDEVDRLVAQGRWDEDAYRRIRADALASLDPDEQEHAGEAIEFVDIPAEPGWIERARIEDSTST